MSQNVPNNDYERVHFEGHWWWRPKRDEDRPVTLAVLDAGQLRVIRGGKYEKWLRADDAPDA